MIDPAVPADLARWSLHCFCLKARWNPKRIVELDINGEILFSAVGGKTREQIDAEGIPVNESQLVLLETFGLVERHDNRINTRIRVVPPDAISHIRDVAAVAADHAFARVSKAARDIVSVLASRDLEASAHAVVFGHALDGVIWDSWRQRGILPDIELTVEEPFWRGVLWAVYPGRPESSGTNELSIGQHHLVMVWDDGSADALRDLASKPGTRALLETITSENHSVSVSSIISDGGDIPIITSEDELQSRCMALAETVANVLPTGESCRRLLADSRVQASAEDAAVIVAHELIWETAELLEEAGVVSRPEVGKLAGRVLVRVDP